MNGDDNDLSRPLTREWIGRMLKRYEDEMRVTHSEDEERGVARRERTTIHMSAWCRLCHNTGIVTIFRRAEDWDIQECPADHREPTIQVHFAWKREPRWFE